MRTRHVQKRVKLLEVVSMISQFHELLNLIFGGFLLLGPIVWRGGARRVIAPHFAPAHAHGGM